MRGVLRCFLENPTGPRLEHRVKSLAKSALELIEKHHLRLSRWFKIIPITQGITLLSITTLPTINVCAQVLQSLPSFAPVSTSTFVPSR